MSEEEKPDLPKVFLVVGLTYGDEGKGTTVDYLVRKHDAKLVVRFNGGPQAAHHVVYHKPEGDLGYHCFSQFGSGTLVPGTRTLLSHHMLVNPDNMMREADVLADRSSVLDALERTHVDPECAVVTPYHRLIGRIREESRGDKRHGSTGIGVGVAAREAKQGPHLRVCDLTGPADEVRARIEEHIRTHLAEAESLLPRHEAGRGPPSFLTAARRQISAYTRECTAESLFQTYRRWVALMAGRITPSVEVLRAALERGEAVVFEGAQGVLLDPHAGFVPHVTKTPCTLKAAESLLAEAGVPCDVRRLGVLRAYGHRHGAGPLVTEASNRPSAGLGSCAPSLGATSELPPAHELAAHLMERHNKANPWQGAFRFGYADAVAVRYALQLVGGVDALVVTHSDKIHCARAGEAPGKDSVCTCPGCLSARICTSYAYMGPDRVAVGAHFMGAIEGASRRRKGVYRLTSIRTPEPDALPSEERTRLLADCVPVAFVTPPPGPRSDAVRDAWLVETLEALLSTPVEILSRGPTWADKYTPA